MKKKLHRLALMLLICICFTANAQEEVSTAFFENQVMRFGQLDPTKVPTGILYEAGFPFTDIETFNGTDLPDSLYVNGGTVKSIYKTIFSSIVDETNESLYNLQIPNEYEEEWLSARNPDEVILSGMLFKYNLFKEDAYQQEQIMVNGSGALIDVPGQNPYTENYTVGIAPGFKTFYGKEMNVKLPSSLFKSNLLENIENIQIDFGDGVGFRTVTFNQPIAVTYATPGDKEWRYKIRISGGLTLDSRSVIGIVDWENPVPVTGSVYCGMWNMTRKVTATKTHLGEYGELNLTIRCSGDGIINNPLIVVEGFDIGNLFDPESKYGTTNLETFRQSLEESPHLRTLLENTNRQYDIIYVDWINGMDYMERNAYALEEAINWVNSIKQGNEPNVIIGQSMGGVVTRYALTDMENNSLAHETNLFISHDAPQQGANIPDSYQFMYRHFSQMYVQVLSGTRILKLKLIPDDLLNQINGITGMLDQPAAKQLLTHWVAGDYSYNNSVHNTFYTNLRGMNSNGGYPELTRNIALSNGSECGTTQHNVQPNANLLNVYFSNKSTVLGDVLGGAIGPIAGAFGGWVFKDWNVFLTGLKAPLSTNKKFTLDIWAKSMSEYAGLQQHVYHADFKYSQKFLGVFNDNLNIFSKDAHSRSGTEFSHFGGGNYQIYNDTDPSENAKFNFGGTVTFNLKPRFNFIPSTSGLDIGRYIHTIGGSALSASYIGAHPPTGTYSSPFENFSTEFNPTNADYHNYRHITFNPRNGKWLAEELNAARNSNNDQIYTDCSFFCGGVEITGVDFICDNGNYVYSFPEIDGATYTWSANGLDIVSGQTTANLTVKDKGTITFSNLTLTVATPDCGTRTFSKNIYLGIPLKPSSISGDTHINIYNNTDFSIPRAYSVPAILGATYYEWELPGNYDIVSSLSPPMVIPPNWELLEQTPVYGNTIQVKSNHSTNGTIKVRACNDCGCSDYTTLNVQHEYHNMPGYQISPNPTGGDLNIILADGAPVPEFPGNRTDVFIYNLSGTLVHQFEISSTGGSTEVYHLPPAVYKVNIDMQNGEFQTLNLLKE